MEKQSERILEDLKKRYPEKFQSEEAAFGHIHRGDRIFIDTGCAEPQYLLKALLSFVEKHPTAFFDAEIFQIYSLGIPLYTDERFRQNFQYTSRFTGGAMGDIIAGIADCTPLFLSNAPGLIKRGGLPVDVALIQTSLPDEHGFVNFGVSVDIVKAAVDNASIVIAQANSMMPRVHGDGFIHIEDVDFIIPHDEPVLEYKADVDDAIAQKIGEYVARLIQDGDTIQAGYGSIPNAVLANLHDKKHLGIHTQLLTDGMVELIKKGVVDNTKKSMDYGRSVAALCMGQKKTYDYINDNPAIEFRTIEYTNNPLVIAQQDNMVAINGAQTVDLTGQATAESVGKALYGGMGGQADFMRGAVRARNGKSIVVLQSTTPDGKESRIAPTLPAGTAVTLIRGDIHYVVTEYGIAYLQGKNIRERTMSLIAIAHPKFRPKLIREAKKLGLIFADQAFVPGKGGEYPESLETYVATKEGLDLLLRPVKIDDEPLLKDFFYSLSDESMYRRFMSVRKDMPHERLQEFSVIDYTKELVILAVRRKGAKEDVVGLGQYGVDELKHTAEAAFVVRDDVQNQGVGLALLEQLSNIARRQGLLGFTAEVLVENIPMLHLFEKMGFDIEKKSTEGTYQLRMLFRE